MTRKPDFEVVPNAGMYEVIDSEGIIVNPYSFKNQLDAVMFMVDCIKARQEEIANQKYWSQSIFGE
jgi:hypothetical protein